MNLVLGFVPFTLFAVLMPLSDDLATAIRNLNIDGTSLQPPDAFVA